MHGWVFVESIREISSISRGGWLSAKSDRIMGQWSNNAWSLNALCRLVASLPAACTARSFTFRWFQPQAIYYYPSANKGGKGVGRTLLLMLTRSGSDLTCTRWILRLRDPAEHTP